MSQPSPEKASSEHVPRVASRLDVSTYFAIANGVVALTLAIGVWALAPGGSLWLDPPAVIAALALIVSSVALILRVSWARLATFVAAVVVLALGLLALTALAVGIAFVRGVTGPLGGGESAIFAVLVWITIPYGVLYPGALLFWSRAETSRSAET